MRSRVPFPIRVADQDCFVASRLLKKKSDVWLKIAMRGGREKRERRMETRSGKIKGKRETRANGIPCAGYRNNARQYARLCLLILSSRGRKVRVY